MLELRQLLAVDTPFATFTGVISTPGEVVTIPITVRSEDFFFASDAVTAQFRVTSAPGSGLDPAAVEVLDGLSMPISLTQAVDDLSSNGESLVSAIVAQGSYAIRVRGETAAVGSFRLDVTLAADFDDSQGVDGADFLVWQRNLGSASRETVAGDYDADGITTENDLTAWSSQLGDSLAADGDNDGDVDGSDFLLWQRNVGGQSLSTDGDFNHDGVVADSDLRIWQQGLGTTRAHLTADGDGNDQVDGADFLLWQRQRGAVGAPINQRGDSDLNGAVDGDDLESWITNFGAATTITPMDASLLVLPPRGSGAVDEATIYVREPIVVFQGSASPHATLLFDLDNDGQFDDLTRSANSGGGFHESVMLPYGVYQVAMRAVDPFGQTGVAHFSFTLQQAAVAISDFSPVNNESLVGSTRHAVIRFDRPVNPATVNSSSFGLTANGQQVAGSIRVASTNMFATFVPDEPLPGSTEIRVTVRGDMILGQDGQPLDANNDFLPGGTLTADFRTAPLGLIPNTLVQGRIVASEPGPQGQDLPLGGVTVRVEGFPNLYAVTDVDGKFTLGLDPISNAPVGLPSPEYFVYLDGSTATTVGGQPIPPNGKYPVVGKKFPSIPGQTLVKPFDLYLPFIPDEAVHPVTPGQAMTISLPASQVAQDPALAMVQLTIPANSLVGSDGTPGTQIGMYRVDSARLPGPLPPGLDHAFDITVQADVDSFDIPAPITFPNVEGRAPGDKMLLMSFDHPSGDWVVVGSMTVSPDGQTVSTDPGVGIQAPGWHALEDGKVPKKRKTTLSTVKTRMTGSITPATIGEGKPTVFDFGPAASPVAPGAIPIVTTTGYDVVEGYGWENALPGPSIRPTAIDRGSSDATTDLTRDFAEPSGEFWVKVNQGLYQVDVTMGDAAAERIHMGVWAEGELRTNVTTAAGQFRTVSMLVPVVDGVLNLGFDSIDSPTPVALNALSIVKVADIVDLSAEDPTGPIFYAAQNLTSGFVQRGKLTSLDELANELIMAPSAHYKLSFYNPMTSGLGAIEVYTSSARFGAVELPDIVLFDPDGPDADADGLADEVEFVIGTNLAARDSDGDGLSDASEVQQGLDPLSGLAFPMGVIASLPLFGQAKEVVLEGSVFDANGQTAFVATGTYGLAIVDASQFSNPIVLGQLDLAGDATDIAIDPLTKTAVVASNMGGLHFVNVADPMSPVLVATISVAASQVEIHQGIAYAAVGGELHAYEVATRDHLQALALGESPLTGLAREGDIVFTMDAARILRAIDVSAGLMATRGAVTLADGGGKLFAGGGIVYAPAANNIRGGYATADVTNPDALVALSGSDVPEDLAAPSGAIALNGSGLALLVGKSPSQATPSVQIIDVSAPADTNQFITRFDMPTTPLGVAIGSGIGYLAMGAGGLQVINYSAFDGLGVAPMASIQTTAVDLQPETPGFQRMQGEAVPMVVTTSDDVQVRTVEVLVNGQVVATDVSYPYELSALLPAGPGQSLATIQARVTDTGGNVATSNALNVALLPDVTPPALVSINPREGELKSQAFRTVVVEFTEAVDPSTLTAQSLQLSGPAGLVAPLGISTVNGGRQVRISYPQLLSGEYQFTMNGDSITDFAGNSVAGGVESRKFSVKQATINWTGAANNFWDNTLNWDLGRLPTATDDVSIDAPVGVTVTVRTGTASVRTLMVEGEFSIVGGVLSIEQEGSFGGRLSLVGGFGALAGAGDATIHSDLLWSGGEMVGPGQTIIAPGATLDFGSQNLNHLARTVVNNGTANFAAGTVAMSDGRFVNNGLFVVNRADAIGNWFGGGGVNVFDNFGTFVKSDEAAMRFFANNAPVAFNNYGTMDIQQGTLSLESGGAHLGDFYISEGATLSVGGTHAFGASSDVIGPGALQLSGANATFDGDRSFAGTFNLLGNSTVSFTGSQVTGGTFNVGGLVNFNAANVQIGVLTLSGVSDLTGSGIVTVAESLVWNGGSMSGAGQTVVPGGATLELTGGGARFLGRSLINNGVANWTAGELRIIELFQNNGVFNINTDDALDAFGVNNGQRTFNNAGTLVKSGTGAAQFIDANSTGMTFANSGTVYVEAGTLHLGSGQLNSGTVIVSPGALLRAQGNFASSPTGTLQVQIAGLVANQIGRIELTSSVAFAGTLQVQFAGGFVPNAGDNFTVVTYPSRTGAFDSITTLNLPAGRQLAPNYGETFLALETAAALAPLSAPMGDRSAIEAAFASLDLSPGVRRWRPALRPKAVL